MPNRQLQFEILQTAIGQDTDIGKRLYNARPGGRRKHSVLYANFKIERP